jgi:excinuclease ABC subunit A
MTCRSLHWATRGAADRTGYAGRLPPCRPHLGARIRAPRRGGTRYAAGAAQIRLDTSGGGRSLPELLGTTVTEAATFLARLPSVRRKLPTLIDLGLGYLTLGEDTPALSGGEAQRLKLATELGRTHTGTLFVFDEPSVGLHPVDIRVLLNVLDRLLETGATVIVIEYDLDMIANADHVIDLGPGGGTDGGRIVATGTPERVAANPVSVTGRHLAGLVMSRNDHQAAAMRRDASHGNSYHDSLNLTNGKK